MSDADRREAKTDYILQQGADETISYVCRVLRQNTLYLSWTSQSWAFFKVKVVRTRVTTTCQLRIAETLKRESSVDACDGTSPILKINILIAPQVLESEIRRFALKHYSAILVAVSSLWCYRVCTVVWSLRLKSKFEFLIPSDIQTNVCRLTVLCAVYR